MSSYPTMCQYAMDRHHGILRWRNLWAGILFIAGTAFVLFIVVAIILLLVERLALGVSAGVATLADGVILAWAVKRQREAVADEGDAYREVLAQCGTTAAADALRRKYRFSLF